MTRSERVLGWLREGRGRYLVWVVLSRSFRAVDPDDNEAGKVLGLIGHKVVEDLRVGGHVEPHHQPLLPTEYRLVENR